MTARRAATAAVAVWSIWLLAADITHPAALIVGLVLLAVFVAADQVTWRRERRDAEQVQRMFERARR